MTLEQHRRYWMRIAKKNGWYKQPFFIIAWVNKRGEITNSVSYDALDRDMIVTV